MKHPTSLTLTGILGLAAALALSPAQAFAADAKTDKEVTDPKGQHADIGIKAAPVGKPCPHTDHPDAQWFPEAGFGLFLHWGISSVDEDRGKPSGLSWPMMAYGYRQQAVDDPKERERMIRERDWGRNGSKPLITPNEYWSAAKDFHPDPQKYDPEKWVVAAKEAGFTYIVLVTKHHEGFAIWPSAYGDFNTNTYMGGRDLVKPFVDACHKHGIKVGLYFSAPDWHFERAFKNFMYFGAPNPNPWLPELDADHNPRPERIAKEGLAASLPAYNALVKGQVEELLTRYGKIDILWFDGAIPAPQDKDTPRLTQERIRELQPGIVLSPRYFQKGDYVTFEGGTLDTDRKPNGWGEWCTTWGKAWSYRKNDTQATCGYILGKLATARSLDINMLLGIGPNSNGELHPDSYKNMAILAGWMKANKPSVVGARALPDNESADVPATAAGNLRYLFACPEYTKKGKAYDGDMKPLTDAAMTLKGLKAAPKSVILLADGKPVENDYKDGTLTVRLPVSRRTNLPDVVKVELEN